ncbi:MAG: Uncharacterized protein E1N59_880 [Puniceicoccaceae bacterium 5H]|nr:MAG: Uncharacterized protein E1N59_880 [Puniceicoccaceae bacterium 5H]
MSQPAHPTSVPSLEQSFARHNVDPFLDAFEPASTPLAPHGHGRMMGAAADVEAPFDEWAPHVFRERSTVPLCLYLHVPFCRHRCAFCPFYRNASREGFSAEYVQLLQRDLDLTADTLRGITQSRRVEAVYFGGGTPSDLDQADLETVLHELKAVYAIDAQTEVTVEGRIRGFTPAKAEAWVQAGATRFSLGLQSTETTLRRRLGRLADRREMRETLATLKATGALVIVDLIFGLPGQTAASLEDDIRFLAEETEVDGLDLYELKQFPGSPMAKMIQSGRLPAPAGVRERGRLYRAAVEALDAQGFEHFTLQHWRRNSRERSLYNRLAKTEADMLPFGSGAGGRLGRISITREGLLEVYRSSLIAGKVPARFTESRGPVTLFASVLTNALELRCLPPLEDWPRASFAWRDRLLANWQEADLLTLPADAVTPIALTPAGCFWATHLQRQLLRLCAHSREAA